MLLHGTAPRKPRRRGRGGASVADTTTHCPPAPPHTHPALAVPREVSDVGVLTSHAFSPAVPPDEVRRPEQEARSENPAGEGGHFLQRGGQSCSQSKTRSGEEKAREEEKSQGDPGEKETSEGTLGVQHRRPRGGAGRSRLNGPLVLSRTAWPVPVPLPGCESSCPVGAGGRDVGVFGRQTEGRGTESPAGTRGRHHGAGPWLPRGAKAV